MLNRQAFMRKSTKNRVFGDSKRLYETVAKITSQRILHFCLQFWNKKFQRIINVAIRRMFIGYSWIIHNHIFTTCTYLLCKKGNNNSTPHMLTCGRGHFDDERKQSRLNDINMNFFLIKTSLCAVIWFDCNLYLLLGRNSHSWMKPTVIGK